MHAFPDDPPLSDVSRPIFIGALAVPASLRSAWLEVACEGDVRVRAAVERLLKHASFDVDATDDVLGTTVGRWRLLRPLGRGGRGCVYEGVATSPWEGPDRAAVKLMSAIVEPGRFADHSHPRLALPCEWGDSPCPWVAAPLVPHAEPILDAAADRAATAADRTRLVMEACEVVASLHAQGIAHGDIAPGNLLVDGAGDVHVIDLDLASGHQMPRDDQRGGTPGFMAPECYDGPATPASDVFALGAVLYRMLAGHNPHPSPRDPIAAAHVARELAPIPLSHFAPGLPHGLEDAINAALSKHPQARPPNAAAFREELDAALQGAIVPRMWGTWMLMVLVVLVVAAVGWLFSPVDRGTSRYSALVLAAEPAGYWDFNEYRQIEPNAGTSSDSLDGTWSGSVSVGQGGIGGAAYLQAGGLTVPSSLPLHLNGPMSIEFWFRLDEIEPPGTTYALSKGRDTGAGFYRMSVGRGVVPGTIAVRAAGRNGTPVLDAQPKADPAAWHHVVWTCPGPGGTQQLWLDGDMVAGQPVPGGIFGTNDEPLMIGRHGESAWAYHHRGWIDEVAVYRGVMPDAEIRRHAEAGLAALSTGSGRPGP